MPEGTSAAFTLLNLNIFGRRQASSSRAQLEALNLPRRRLRKGVYEFDPTGTLVFSETLAGELLQLRRELGPRGPPVSSTT